VLRAAASVLVLAAIASTARAGAGESALSVSLGWATYATLDDMGQTVNPTAGAALGVTYERGISEALSWRIGVTGGGFLGGGTSVAGWATGGLVYRFDVLKYVPYVEGSLGGVVVGGDPLPTGVDPLLELGAGLDVLVDRQTSWGVEGQLGSFAGGTTVLTIGLRGTWRWGYF
jgi:hypothetical protein